MQHRFLFTAIIFLHATVTQADVRVVVEPTQVQLRGIDSRQQLIVGQLGGERDVDLTRNAQFVSEQPGIVAVTPAGVLTPKADGTATIVITSGGQTVRVPVTVTDATKALPIDFENDVTPILTLPRGAWDRVVQRPIVEETGGTITELDRVRANHSPGELACWIGDSVLLWSKYRAKSAEFGSFAEVVFRSQLFSKTSKTEPRPKTSSTGFRV